MSEFPTAETELEAGDFLILKSMLELAEERMSRRQLLELADYLLDSLDARIRYRRNRHWMPEVVRTFRDETSSS